MSDELKLQEFIARGIAEVNSNLENAKDPLTGSGEGEVSFDFVGADKGTVDSDSGSPVIGNVDITVDGKTVTLFQLGSSGPIAQSVEDQSALMNLFSTAGSDLFA